MNEMINENKQKKKTKNKISNFLWNTLGIVSALILISFVFTFFTNGCSYSKANVFGYRIVSVLSGSMEPTIDTHAMCVCDYTVDEYQVGDIIVYQQEVEGRDLMIIHRIIDIDDNGLIQTKGDNNPVQDPWQITQDQISGKITAIGNWTAPIWDFILGNN